MKQSKVKEAMREKLGLPKFYSIEDLRREYERTSQGHWFDADTMRFFRTRLTSHFRIVDWNTYLFVTTEANPNGERKASLRMAKIEVEPEKHCGYRIKIDTLGEFHSLSLYEAKRDLKNFGGI